MVTQLADDATLPAAASDRARQAWYILVQLAVLALLALALYWASQPPDPANPIVELQRPELQRWQDAFLLYRLPLMVFGGASLLFACIPPLRRSPIAAILGGVTLGTACWLSSVHLWQPRLLTEVSATVPLMAPVLFAAVVFLFALGLFARAGVLRGTTGPGQAALAGWLLLTGMILAGSHAVVSVTSLHGLGYEITRDQLWEMLAAVTLFLPAIWLGGVAVRRESRWCFQPLGMALVLAIFIVMGK